MRANELPTEREIVEGLKPRPNQERNSREIRDLAIRAAELTIGEAVRERDLLIKMKLGEGTYKVPHFPVRNLKINGHEPYSYEVENDKGILYLLLPETEHVITYRTGFEQSLIPAVYRELVLKLGRYLFGGDEEDRTDVIGLINTARRLRAKTERSRDAIQADGEVESQGPPGYR